MPRQQSWLTSSLGALLLLITLFWPRAVTGQASRFGREFQVNIVTTGPQQASAVSSTSDDGFLVVWQSLVGFPSDEGWSVRATGFDRTGNRRTGEHVVEFLTSGDQVRPAVTPLSNGTFLVAWMSDTSVGSDSSGWSVQARILDADASPLGEQFQVNSITTGHQSDVSAVQVSDSRVVLVWGSQFSEGSDDGDSIQARFIDLAGTPLGQDFQVNSLTTNVQLWPEVDSSGDGTFVVTWTSESFHAQDASQRNVHAQKFDENGVALCPEYRVNLFTSSYQHFSSIAVSPNGNFVVSWESYGSSSGDDSSYSVQARVFDATCHALNAEFLVNKSTWSQQVEPSVAASRQGEFIVAWTSQDYEHTDTNYFSVKSRRFTSAGAPRSSEFQVNTGTLGSQQGPALAFDTNGNFIVTWTSDTSLGSDSSGRSVQAQLFDQLFRDGFEVGSTTRWSMVAR